MNKFYYIISAFLLAITLLSSCGQTKHVPDGEYLLKKNKINIEGDDLGATTATVIKQEPNHKTLGFKTKLWFYNHIDSTKVAEKRAKKNLKIVKKNKKRRARERKINQRRIERSIANGNDYYKEKDIELKDTLDPKLFFREWLKYEIGEAPVILDTNKTRRSVEQLNIYLNKKGYFYGKVTSSTKYKAKRQKAVVTYNIVTGKPYIVDSIYLTSTNNVVRQTGKNYLNDDETGLKPPFQFDTYYLDEQRSKMAEYMRNDAIYGFRRDNVVYEIDTIQDSTGLPYRATLKVIVKDRYVVDPNDSENQILKPFKTTLVNKVYFHLSDTSYYDGNFKAKVESMGLELTSNFFLNNLDTTVFSGGNDDDKDTILRRATFFYNQEMFIDPEIIEFQNYLEETNYYKGYYLERSYRRLLQLELFQTVKPVIREVDGTNKIDIHYYLIPVKRQSFGIEPRATNSNGFLGVSSTINYTNKNLFRGGEKLVVSFSGGFESQPAVFDETINGEKIKTADRSFNTLEYGPSIKLEFPGLFPIPLRKLPKRNYPKTVVSTAYNFQRRTDFRRETFQLNLNWRFTTGQKSSQVVTLGLPFMSVIKIVNLNKTPEFEQRLQNLNDLFLLNTYSDQFIWEDLLLKYEFSNKNYRTGKWLFYYNANFDLAGLLMQALTRNKPETPEGFKEIFGLKYSEFVRLDNELKWYQTLTPKSSLNYRIQAGGGIPLNNAFSLPFDYAFFAGGSNDNRGFRARGLGPGTYKYYLDTNRTATQVGDIRFGATIEYRFSMGGIFNGAFFTDVGNVWTMNEDPNRPGAKFTSNWYRELAFAGGAGIRVDLDFFIIRVDIGLPLRNPALPEGSRWIFQDDDAYIQEGIDAFGDPEYKDILPNPFRPQLHIGIGYPF